MAIAASAVVLLTAACGSESSDDAGSAGGGSGVDLAAAQAAIEPLTKPAEEFPLTEPLAERPPAGTTVAFLDIGTPALVQFYEQLQEAAEVMGVELQHVQTGRSPQEINAAMNTVVESEPDAVIDVALDPALFTPQLEALQEQGAFIVVNSIVNGEEFGFDDSQIGSGKAGATENGKVMASTLLAETNGEATELVFYRVPELPFAELELQGAKERLAEQCPDCELRVVDIPITEVGSTASRTVVSDLQANPDTQAFIASIDELQIGLPAAMEVAGLDVPGVGLSPTPVNLQQIAAGEQLASLATDIKTLAWFSMDRVARGLAGQEQDYSFLAEPTAAIAQVFTKDNVPSDPNAGYIAFPDYKEKFAELWTVE
ncbi:sugar ABC transporter substrate-binding protein [Geodermatophilus sp. URMC 62]|uniref:sugar ABC transporter substrate-binding protein n=1 Tax=Geodermatophilus sp. URMC 62 TaxID=3423414 RepID=UPI00406C2342